ncbi:MAG: ABC transporter ATP-binding protein/permease [Steroidobacteraceae bacterium]|nr:ABC transporter ATP-binding protein/permease [Steroidobacteraceae bacterium]
MAGSAGGVRLRDVFAWAGPIIGPDRNFITLAIIYGIGIALLSLATPISVQMLINSIANTGMLNPLLALSGILLVLLLLWALLSAFRTYLMEIFRRRFVARLAAEITVRVLHAENPFLQDDRRSDLLNRYFELMTVNKAIPGLFVGGFAILLQGGIGLILTSFYHPFFLIFNLLFGLLLWIIWRVFLNGAMNTSVEACRQKYALAHWLECVGASDGFYKSGRHLEFAMQRTEERTAEYIQAQKDYFGRLFPQNIALFLLYAVASAALLALGGWLVIREQLTIGQLVAAELILSGVYAGVAQLGTYLEYFFDLVASLDELNLIYSLKQENRGEGVRHARRPPGATLVLNNVRFTHEFGPVQFNLTLPEGASLVACGDPGMERLFSRLLKRHLRPESGLVVLGGVDIASLDIVELRSDVIVLDRPNIVETTIEEYLKLSNTGGDPAEVIAALKLVGLLERTTMLPEGLQTPLSSTGWPLSLPKTMQLKLAGALLSKPRILVLSPMFDMVSLHRMEAVLKHLATTRTTVIYFTNRPEDVTLDGYLWLGREEQKIFTNRQEFDRLRSKVGKGPPLVPA